jgi:hypothetical protein
MLGLRCQSKKEAFAITSMPLTRPLESKSNVKAEMCGTTGVSVFVF